MNVLNRDRLLEILIEEPERIQERNALLILSEIGFDKIKERAFDIKLLSQINKSRWK